MKATIDVPDALYRRVKARAALDGRAVRDVTIELYERWLVGEDGGIDRISRRHGRLAGALEGPGRPGPAGVDRPTTARSEIIISERR
ncbi:MAG: hypothetical protein U0667_08530 [Chloroflexota bacterium]